MQAERLGGGEGLSALWAGEKGLASSVARIFSSRFLKLFFLVAGSGIALFLFNDFSRLFRKRRAAEIGGGGGGGVEGEPAFVKEPNYLQQQPTIVNLFQTCQNSFFLFLPATL